MTGAIGVAVVLAACGFDGAGGLASSVSGTEPGPSRPGDAVPESPASAPSASPEAGPGPSTPITACSDATLAFDGVDDFATVPDDSGLDLSDDFTVEAWIKPGPKVATGAEMDIVSHHDASASRGWVLLVKAGRVELAVYGSESFSDKSYSAGDTGPAYVVAGKWAHVAGSLHGDTLRVYYDGVLRDTQDLAFLFGRDAYHGALRLGRSAHVEDFRFQGELDDVRLSKTARYTGATAPRPTALLSLDDAAEASWRFDEASGNKLDDAAKHNHDGSLAPDTTAPTRVASTCIADR